MAEISSSQQAYGKDGTYLTFLTSLDTNTGAFYTIMYDETGKIVTKGTPEEVISLLTKVKTDRTALLADNSISTITSQKQSLTAQYQQQVPPPNTEPVPPPTNEQQTNQQNKQFVASGGANDETGGEANNNQTTSTSGDPSSTNTTPEIVITANRPNSSRELPGKRLYNPLSMFSSYNYQLTLYMITPDAYDAFMRSDRKNINAFVQGDVGNKTQGSGGAYILAQSGGLGTDTPRAPGMKYDYYIDNLKITSIINTKAANTATNTTNISFSIYEPYGFSFISQLNKSADILIQNSKIKNLRELKNATRQFFILGIKFLGYDKEGKIISGPELAKLTGNSESGRTFEYFYDLKIKSFKFKLDGKLTVYDVTAVSLPAQTAFGTVRGRISTGLEISGKTVEDTLKALTDKLNTQQEEITKTTSGDKSNNTVKDKNVYKIEYLGDIEDLKNASTVTDADKKDKTKWPMSPLSTTVQANEGYSVKASPDNTKRTFSFGKSITIMQAINSIIAQSTYLADALTAIQSSEIDSMAGASDTLQNPKPPKTLRWYNLSSSVKVLDLDKATGDFNYEITYYIQPYEIPYLPSPFVGKTAKYYGPHKRYDYYYTGQNSEVIGYEQVLNNAYFMATLIPTGSENSQGGAADVPTQPLQQANEARDGGLNTQRSTQNTVETSLYDPGSFARAKITIMGDPDFLMQDSPSSSNQIYKQYYGSNGYTINPNGGQVFVEIDFKEGVDYENSEGLMTINESIQFWKYSPEVSKKVKGVSYMLVTVDSSFSSGKFTQVLNGIITTFPPEKKESSNPNQRNDDTSTKQNTNTPATIAAQQARRTFAATDPRRRLVENPPEARTPTNNNVTVPAGNPNQTSLGDGFKSDAPPPTTDSSDSLYYTQLLYTTGETQYTSPTGGGPGINEPVAGGVPEYNLNPSAFNTPTTNLNVANDEAAGATITPQNLRKTIDEADAGRETTNPDQTNRNLV